MTPQYKYKAQEERPDIKALLVGINEYPEKENRLRGCVNDVVIARDIIIHRFGAQARNVRMLCDKRATTKAIKERLDWLVGNASPGDHLLFWYSGHGSQLANQTYLPGSDYEPDHMDEILCPVDFDWDGNNIRDDFINTTVQNAAVKGCAFTLVFDCCHSGTMARTVQPPDTKPRFIEPPIDIVSRLGRQVALAPERITPGPSVSINVRSVDEVAVADNNPDPKLFLTSLFSSMWGFFGRRRVSPILKPNELPENVIVITGCRDDQTSSDAFFGNRYQGAMSYMLQYSLVVRRDIRYNRVYDDLLYNLRATGFTQVPQLNYNKSENNKDIINKPFLFKLKR